MTIEASAGVLPTVITTQVTFTLTLVDPCPTSAILSINTQIFSVGTYDYNLRDNMVPYTWDATTVATTSGVQVDCGAYDVRFENSDGSSLDSVIFSDNRLTTPY